MPRQKIPSDCWPHSISGRGAAERRNEACGGTGMNASPEKEIEAEIALLGRNRQAR